MSDDLIVIIFTILILGVFGGAIAYGIITAERCPTCGVILYDDANYCYRCGTPVSKVAIKLENAKKGSEE